MVLYDIDDEERLGAVVGADAKAASVRRRAIIFWLALSPQPTEREQKCGKHES